MKWRIEFRRKPNATIAGEAQRRFAIEVTARNAEEAVSKAKAEGNRQRSIGLYFDVANVRKI